MLPQKRSKIPQITSPYLINSLPGGRGAGENTLSKVGAGNTEIHNIYPSYFPKDGTVDPTGTLFNTFNAFSWIIQLCLFYYKPFRVLKDIDITEILNGGNMNDLIIPHSLQ